MAFSQRFLDLVDQQLSSFDSDAELEVIVAYVAKSDEKNSPTLQVVGQRPAEIRKVFLPIENDPDLRIPSANRRWYPLQDGSILLGVLRAERYPSDNQWPESLDQRLQISASTLANCLSLELDREKVMNELSQQREQIGVLVHQLRNPLTALRTYAQLLLRKIDPESSLKSLIEGLLTEQKQVDKYLVALDEISQAKIASKTFSPTRMLLPPFLPKQKSLRLIDLLIPLIDRAKVTANLQGYQWIGPDDLPQWIQESTQDNQGFIAEIVANLLENAFRYAPKGASIGLCINDQGICVWDTGDPIPLVEREKIFERGYRGEKHIKHKGSGLGLNLAKQLANQCNAEIVLIDNPSEFNKYLPVKGNAFIISFKQE